MPGRLRIAIEAAPNSLDPRYASDANASRIASLVHCALVRTDARGGWAPQLASSWSRPDETTWLFTLRDDARFHDGAPVTADDVVATYRSVLDPSSLSPKRGALASLDTVEAVAPREVRFRLHEADASFLDAAAIGVISAQAAARHVDAGAAAPDGCGPYRVASEDDHSVILEAAATSLQPPASLSSIEFRVVPDTVMRTLELAGGEVDFSENTLEPDEVRHLQRDATTLAVSVTDYDAFQYLGINHRHPALADVRVRRAIALAIDRDSIVANLLDGQAAPATGMIPPHREDYEGRVRHYRYDPARARRLLDRAGLVDPDGDGPLPRLRLRYATSTVELRRRIAEVIAAELGDVGIEVTIESHEWGTFFDDISRGNFDLYSLAWVGIRDPDLYRLALHSAMLPPAGSNRGFFRNARIDALTERGRSENDPATRRRIYARVQRTAARTLPVIPLWWPKNVVVMTTRLHGFVPDPTGELIGLARARLD
ncbi:MAG TPA: ABC transporter substrate-binding protein [Candidatus Binatia bacterium]